MDFQPLKNELKEFARDIRLNVGSVLSPEGAPDLNPQQIAGIALASAISSGNAQLIALIEQATADTLDDSYRNAARAAATIMAMNNVYYRFSHSIGDADYSAMPARLRMNVIGNPGIDKADFELISLAVSAINNCQFCVKAHEQVVRDAGISKQAVHSAVRVAAVITAAGTALIADNSGDLAQAA